MKKAKEEDSIEKAVNKMFKASQPIISSYII